MFRGIAPEAFPRETAPLAATIQPFEQEGMDGLFETVEGAAVVRHSKVIEVASHLPHDRLPEVREGPCIALLVEPLREVLQSAAQPLLGGLALQAHQPIPASPPVMREAEVVHSGVPAVLEQKTTIFWKCLY